MKEKKVINFHLKNETKSSANPVWKAISSVCLENVGLDITISKEIMEEPNLTNRTQSSCLKSSQ